MKHCRGVLFIFIKKIKLNRMMSIRRTRLIVAVSFLLILAGCEVTSKVSLKNLVSLYQPEKQFSDLECCVFHTSDSTSTLFVRVVYSDLVYEKDQFTGLFTSSYSLNYKLTSGYEFKDVLSTNSIVSGDSLNYGKSAEIVHSFDIKVKRPGDYLLEITLFDMNRQSSSTRFFKVFKNTSYGRQNFLVLNRNQELIFKNYMMEREPVRIISDDISREFLYVSYYHRDFPLARPPYTDDREPVFDFRPDSAYQLALSNGESEWVILDKPGFYHFRKDTVSREGLTLYHFPEGFPEVTTAEQLRDPLRYITTRKEYDTLLMADNVKAAVDNFWLKTSRSPERAKILIQRYYSNVEEANKYFTSYLEGWKTDRGLIYIIFGRPDYVYRANDSEEWIYGEPENRSSLRYTFARVNNHFTDNDYMLLRSPTLKESWFITVQSWRR
jgi:GWxTD domain-containing protein